MEWEYPEPEVSPGRTTEDLDLLHRGEVIDRYVVECLLGRGGMAVVYRVRHRQLGSLHALKVLTMPSAGIRARLLQEGRAQARLNHPNVVTVTDVVEVRGAPGLVMECIEGPSLRDLLLSGPLSTGQALDLGTDIIRGVAAAHRLGLVHRDIKPGNILLAVRPDGLVAKVGDFGLAKLLGGEGVDSAARTRSGVMLGTPAYMAPEQIEDSRSVDARCDVFAIGAVLYEMVTGERAFPGESVIEIAYRICNGQLIPPSHVDPSLPEAMEAAILRALRREPSERTPDCAALLVDWAGDGAALSSSSSGLRSDPELLERARLAHPEPSPDSEQLLPAAATPVELSETHEIGSVRPPGPLSHTLARPQPPERMPRRLLLPLVSSLVVVGVVLAWLLLQSSGVRLEPELTQLTFQPGQQLFGALSGDGRQLVYSDGGELMLRRVEGERAMVLTGDFEPAAVEPAFSPDGETLAFAGGDALYLMGATGESPRRIADGGRWPSWSPDGHSIAFSTHPVEDFHNRTSFDSRLRVVDVKSGEVRSVGGDEDAVFSDWSPDGRWLVFAGGLGVFTVPSEGGTPHKVFVGGWAPRWAPDGRSIVLLNRKGSATELLRLPIGRNSGEVDGPPEVLASSVLGFARHLSTSADGRRMVLSSTVTESRIRSWELDPSGPSVLGGGAALGPPGLDLASPALSADGERLAFTTIGEMEDLWVAASDGQGAQRLSRGKQFTRGPRWSPEGDRLVFYGARDGGTGLWTVRGDGGEETFLSEGLDTVLMLPVWSPDGTRLAASEIGMQPYVFDLGVGLQEQVRGQRRPEAMGWVATSWSPDGRSLALSTGDTAIGRLDVATGSIELLDIEGYWAVWMSDSQRLVVAGASGIAAFDTATAERSELLDLGHSQLQASPPLWLSADDRRLLVATERVDGDLWLVDLVER